MPGDLPRFVSVRALRSYNVHATGPVLVALLDTGGYAERSSDTFPGFAERLLDWLPGLRAHQCSIGRPGGFVRRLELGTYLPHVTEHVCIALQNELGFDVAFGRARETETPGVSRLVVSFREERAAREALAGALALTLAAMEDHPFDVAGEIERLRAVADDARPGPSTEAIVAAALRRGIPVLPLTPDAQLIQLGYGVAQKRIRASETSETSAIAVEVCQHKPLTSRLLRTFGVPVPEGRSVRDADAAWAAARALGLPVVVKPCAGNQGKGVSVDLRDEASVRGAFALAASFDDEVLVERFVPGADHRLLVVGGKLAAAARREPAHVVGDGARTIEALVEEANQDPRRRPGHGGALTRLALDAAADLVLRAQGLSRASVPASGARVLLRSNANLSTGGSAADVTDAVHPENARLAVLAARILGIDVAGVDVVCGDIERPLAEQGGAIVEVNAAPGLRMHLAPSSGQPRDVGGAIVDTLFPRPAESRIPILSITGTNGKTTVARLLAHAFATAHRRVGLACTDGVYVGGERILAGDCAGPISAETVLLHPSVEVAVLEAARGGILREGLGYDGCDVGVVTNVGADHLGADGIETIEDLARVKQVVIEAVRPGGAAVLNAADPLVAAMAADTRAPVIYWSARRDCPVVASHLASGGRAVCVDGDAIVLRSGDARAPLLELSRLRFAEGGRIGFQLENALAAAAAAWGAGLNPALIARALSTFQCSTDVAPGRFNRFPLGGVEVVLDYAHNLGALSALAAALDALGARRTVLVLTLPGDRRDDDLVASFRVSLAMADHLVLYQGDELRGRREGELFELLRPHVPAGLGCDEVIGQADAIHKAWQQLAPGERLVVIAESVDGAIGALNALPVVEGSGACELALPRTRRGGGEEPYAAQRAG